MNGLGDGLDDQGSVFLVGPLAHGGVIVLGVFVAEKPKDEYAVRRTDAALSIREYLLVRGDAVLVQYLPDLLWGFEPVCFPVH